MCFVGLQQKSWHWYSTFGRFLLVLALMIRQWLLVLGIVMHSTKYCTVCWNMYTNRCWNQGGHYSVPVVRLFECIPATYGSTVFQVTVYSSVLRTISFETNMQKGILDDISTVGLWWQKKKCEHFLVLAQHGTHAADRYVVFWALQKYPSRTGSSYIFGTAPQSYRSGVVSKNKNI